MNSVGTLQLQRYKTELAEITLDVFLLSPDRPKRHLYKKTVGLRERAILQATSKIGITVIAITKKD